MAIPRYCFVKPLSIVAQRPRSTIAAGNKAQPGERRKQSHVPENTGMPPHPPGPAGRPGAPGSRPPDRRRRAGRLRAGHHRRRGPPWPSRPGLAHRPRRRGGCCCPGNGSVSPPAAATPAASARATPCGAGATTTSARLGTGATATRTCRSRSPSRRQAGPASPPAVDHTCATRSDGHTVVLGRQRRRRARHRHHHQRRPAAAGHHPRGHRLGQRHRRRCTPARPVPTAPCGAGASNN